jgi:hypothetical protein
MQSPQFDTQNDPLVEDGIHSIPQWRAAMTMTADQHPLCLIELDLDPDIRDVFLRLRNVFIASVPRGLSTTDLHDLTIFLLHKLLAWSPQATQSHSSDSVATSQCVRYALVLYMLIIHGPAYFSHAHLQINLVSQFKTNLEGILAPLSAYHRPLALWMLLVGLTASPFRPRFLRIFCMCVPGLTSFLALKKFSGTKCRVRNSSFRHDGGRCGHWTQNDHAATVCQLKSIGSPECH